ncbi:hypothetical protein MTsPCn5_28850 [Croceitalea sp. MTPC5]|nr:hypothetical protein MTsPCn5_28850 [Croceitalea sp. MTPC5]
MNFKALSIFIRCSKKSDIRDYSEKSRNNDKLIKILESLMRASLVTLIR